MERTRIIYSENEVLYVERKEAERIQKLLRIIPYLKEWTPLSKIAKRLRDKIAPTISTARALRGAQRIEIEHAFGTEILAEKPIIEIRKARCNKRKKASKTNYIRAPIYIRSPQLSEKWGHT